MEPKSLRKEFDFKPILKSENIEYRDRIKSVIINLIEKDKKGFYCDELLESLEEISSYIATSVSELAIVLNIPTSFVSHFILDKNPQEEYFMAMGSPISGNYDKEKFAMAINATSLNDIGKLWKTKKFRMMASIRFSIAHELYHRYTARHFKSTYKKTKQNQVINSDAYRLDRGELSANLFAINHLRHIIVDNEELKSIFKEYAEKKFEEIRV